MYFEAKQVQDFYKGVGRFIDHTGKPMWFELTAQTQQELLTRARNYMPGRAGVFSNVTVKGSVYYSGRHCINLNPQTGVRCAPLPSSDARFTELSAGPAEPQGHIIDALHCENGERVDLVGLVIEMKICPAIHKVEAWLKDVENGKMILAEFWGETFFKLMNTAIQGATVLQVENARAIKKDEDKVHLTAEFFKDSKMASSWVFLNPGHTKGMRLTSLTAAAGERISTVWAPNGMSMMQCSDKNKFKTCLRTLKTCSLSWTDTAQNSQDGHVLDASSRSSVAVGQALPTEVQVEVHGVWLTHVSNPEPIYTRCKHCRTKIDDQGNCKNSSQHAPEPDSVKAALSSVRLADFGADMDDILANGESLCALAGVTDVDELESMIRQHGVSGLRFCKRCDVVLGSNQVKKSLKQNSETDAECKFEILRVTPLLLGEWDSPARPALKKVWSLIKDHGAGAILPISNLSIELVPTLSGYCCCHCCYCCCCYSAAAAAASSSFQFSCLCTCSLLCFLLVPTMGDVLACFHPNNHGHWQFNVSATLSMLFLQSLAAMS